MDDKGIPEHPRIVLVQPRWQAGFSLPQLSAPEVGSAKNKPKAKSVLKGLLGKSDFVPLELTTFTNKSRNEFNTSPDRSQVMPLLHFPSGRHLYTLRWVNPHPHLEIKSLTLKGHGSGPTSVVVVAVTLEL